MCGIVGIIDYGKNGFFAKDRDVFQDLLVVNSLRGAHSTGMFGGNMDYTVDYVKTVGNAYDLIENPEVKPVWEKFTRKWKFVVGHGRQATRGKVTPNNAHPFHVNNITMVHNGTVFNSKLVDTFKHDVDSNAIAHALAENDAVDVLSDIDGAYAIVWHDEKTKKLHMARNKERPLAIAISDDQKRVYFASELSMLQLVAARRGIKLGKSLYIPEDTILTFDSRSPEYTETKIPKKIKHFHPPTQNTTPVVPFTPKANWKEGRITKVTSKSTGVAVKLDDNLVFSITEVILLSKRGNEEIRQVFGFMDGFPEMEIAGLWKGKEEDLYTIDCFMGKVKSIARGGNTIANKDKDFVVYVAEIEPSNLLITADGYTLSKSDFVSFVQYGCDSCHKEIKEEDAKDVLILDHYVFCPKCSKEIMEDGIANSGLPSNIKSSVGAK